MSYFVLMSLPGPNFILKLSGAALKSGGGSFKEKLFIFKIVIFSFQMKKSNYVYHMHSLMHFRNTSCFLLSLFVYLLHIQFYLVIVRLLSDF